MNFRDKLYRFMEGRYGMRALSDKLQICLVAVYVVLVFVNIFARSRWISGLQSLLILYTVFRILSKNIPARENENRLLTAWIFKVQEWWRFRSANAQERKARRAEKEEQRKKEAERRKDKDHIYRTCPHCGATLRLPKKKGRHGVICPRCREKFSVDC